MLCMNMHLTTARLSQVTSAAYAPTAYRNILLFSRIERVLDFSIRFTA
jgi:hypothetical protein